MFRILDKAFAILAMAAGALLVCLITWPIWTVTIFAALLLIGWHEQKRQLCETLARSVAVLTPQEYEQHCAALLQQAGWTTALTPSQDQGVDVVAEIRGRRAVIQCKKYRGRVGNAAVQEIIAGKMHYKADIAVVVCVNGYTRAACDLAQSCRVHLLHHDALPRLERIARIS